jgi:hypothetical protein
LYPRKCCDDDCISDAALPVPRFRLPVNNSIEIIISKQEEEQEEEEIMKQKMDAHHSIYSILGDITA